MLVLTLCGGCSPQNTHLNYLQNELQKVSYNNGISVTEAKIIGDAYLYRYAREGNLEEAEERFREADSHMYYDNSVRGLRKLQNQTMLVETLLARGQDAEAHMLLSKVRAVNPVMIAEFEEAGLKTLGLERV